MSVGEPCVADGTPNSSLDRLDGNIVARHNARAWNRDLMIRRKYLNLPLLHAAFRESVQIPVGTHHAPIHALPLFGAIGVKLLLADSGTSALNHNWSAKTRARATTSEL